MAELDLPYGPWKRLASCDWDGFPVSVYLNPDKLLLTLLYEKHGEQVSGMLVALKKVFVTDLDLTKTMQTQRREMTVIQKASRERVSRYLLVGATPAYCNYGQEALVECIGRQMNELQALTQFTQDLAQAYKAGLKELKNAGDEYAQTLLGDPLAMLSLYNPQGAPLREQRATKAVVGLDSRGEFVQLPVNALSASIVVGGRKQDRLHLMHVLIESALTNNIPCLVFDSNNCFTGLAKPSKDTRGFTQHGMTAMPLGFPFQEFALGRGVYIDLSVVPPSFFLHAFGLQETEVGRILEKGLGREGVNSLSQLGEQVRAFKESREATQYAINKCLRCIRVIEAKYPSVFGKNPPSEVLLPWHEGIGKVFHLNTKGAPAHLQFLLIATLLRLIQFPGGKSVRVLVGFDADLSELYTDVLLLAEQAREKGAGFLLQAEHELDVQALENPSLEIELVGGEAVASMEGEKPLRFTARPTYTECSETNTASTQK